MPCSSGQTRATRATLAGVILAAVALVACTRPGGPDRAYPNPPPAAATASTTPPSVVPPAPAAPECPPVRSSQPLRPRDEIATGTAVETSAPNTYFTADLFDLFKSVCGGCHVAGSYGNFTVTAADFAQKITARVVETNITTDVATALMPPFGTPTGRPYSQRDATDPVVQLATLLKIWIAQGSPTGSFILPGKSSVAPPPTAEGGAPDYTLSPGLAAQITNLGSCVPNGAIVAVEPRAMDTLDENFASAKTLPKTLAETDLTTFDSRALARRGVLSFAPAYPLWSDDAGKMRHVRVPRGQTIAFDKESQKFRIPPNTRLYKTFFKKIVAADGSERHRKIETRLIVSRPDEVAADGTTHTTALFGTYVWNAEETEASLLQTPLNNLKPFKDRLISYIADEPRAQAIRDSKPTNLDYALQVQNPGVLRHYAIPGSERCIQCHMGSAAADFVLGFTPLQLARRPLGESGVMEEAMGDELTQLTRFIDYGLISGMTSAADVLPLEATQGARKPRNEHELRAQAYLLGNCAHCHNPRGFPSMKDPELKDVLDFLPGPGANQGIFQFPLDRMSPVRARGRRQDIPIPYLTPSLRDLPDLDPSYRPKYQICEEGRMPDGWCTKKGQTIDFIDAPWRSLIYRNVDTPFDYVDDFTIFPHMPMATSGHDCRVSRLMGDWMVSIPATRASPVSEDIVGTGGDASPQPYVEVKPSDPGYAAAAEAARKRLDAYHAGHRYDFCPTTVDIVDPAVLSGRERQTPADVPVFDRSTTPATLVMQLDGVPNRAHWVVTDATDPPGDWLPRNPGWKKSLVDQDVTGAGLSGEALANLTDVVAKLKDVRITESMKSALLAEIPFGLWQRKPGCDFGGVPTAGGFQGDRRPVWLDVKGGTPNPTDPTAPVYVQSAGAAIFNNICVNCHGPHADAKGLLADEISIMTGGDARVANFRSGLFGPLDNPTANRQRVFNLPGAGPDDFGARYLAWMALGGTQKTLPSELLKVVANSRVFGQSRNNLVARGTANMLQLAQQLCTGVLPSNQEFSRLDDLESFFRYRALDWTKQTSLISDNGDAEMWLRVCSLDNRPVVRVPVPAHGTWAATASARDVWISFDQSLYWGDGVDSTTQAPAFPADAPVMDQRGRIVKGLTSDNLFPLCVQAPNDPIERKAADDFLAKHRVGGESGEIIPYCPPALFATVPGMADERGRPLRKWRLTYRQDTEGTGLTVFTDANKWANRGAINAGVAVFLYVDQLAKGQTKPKPPYNQCELLSKPQTVKAP